MNETPGGWAKVRGERGGDGRRIYVQAGEGRELDLSKQIDNASRSWLTYVTHPLKVKVFDPSVFDGGAKIDQISIQSSSSSRIGGFYIK